MAALFPLRANFNLDALVSPDVRCVCFKVLVLIKRVVLPASRVIFGGRAAALAESLTVASTIIKGLTVHSTARRKCFSARNIVVVLDVQRRIVIYISIVRPVPKRF